MSRRRQQTAVWSEATAGPPRGRGRWHVCREERGTGETLPYLAAKSGEDRGYKAGRLKSRGAGRESEGPIVPEKACKTTRWREGALL